MRLEGLALLPTEEEALRRALDAVPQEDVMFLLRHNTSTNAVEVLWQAPDQGTEASAIGDCDVRVVRPGAGGAGGAGASADVIEEVELKILFRPRVAAAAAAATKAAARAAATKAPDPRKVAKAARKVAKAAPKIIHACTGSPPTKPRSLPPHPPPRKEEASPSCGAGACAGAGAGAVGTAGRRLSTLVAAGDDAAVAALADEMRQAYSLWLQQQGRALRRRLREQARGEEVANSECALCLLPLREAAAGAGAGGAELPAPAPGGGGKVPSDAAPAGQLLCTTSCGHTFHLRCLRRAKELGHHDCPTCTTALAPGLVPVPKHDAAYAAGTASAEGRQRIDRLAASGATRWAAAEGLGPDGRRLRNPRAAARALSRNLPSAQFGSSLARFSGSTWGVAPGAQHASHVM